MRKNNEAKKAYMKNIQQINMELILYPYAVKVNEFVEGQIDYLQRSGVLSGHEVGEYI